MLSAIKKSAEQIKAIARAGKIVASCHQQLSKRLVPGMKTSEIDHFIDWFMTEHGAVPAQKGYKGYPYASCISVNEVACHGFPGDYELKDGDIVTIDFVAEVKGWKADSAWTYMIGNVSEEARQLVRAAKSALFAGLKAAKAGNQLSAIGEAIEDRVKRDGFKVITAFAGHGIGKQLHEPPQVLHAKLPQPGFILEEGMVITIEPILSAGSPNIYIEPDGWTARTVDHALTAQFEHTIVITKGEPQLLTAWPVKRSKEKASAAKPAASKQTITKQTVAKPAASKQTITKQTVAKQTAPKQAATKQTVVKPAAPNQTTTKQVAAKELAIKQHKGKSRKTKPRNRE